jgi:hypothetical protein
MEIRDNQPKSYKWFEPKWSYRPRLKAELLGILNFKMWLRISLVVVLLTGLLVLAVKREFPDLEFNWILTLLASLGWVVVALYAFIAFLWFMPPYITIDHQGIFCQQGRSVEPRLRSDIRCVTIDVTNPSRPLLLVESTKRAVKCGIPPQVSLPELRQFLRDAFPELPVTETRC